MENTNYNQTRRRSFFNAYFVQTLLKQYANFSGVQSRKSYWLTILAYFIISIGVAGLLFITSVVYSSPADMPLVSAIGSLFGLIFLIPCIAIAVRRLRDAGQNPWLFLLVLIPVVGSIIVFVLLCLPSRYQHVHEGSSFKFKDFVIIFASIVLYIVGAAMLANYALVHYNEFSLHQYNSAFHGMTGRWWPF